MQTLKKDLGSYISIHLGNAKDESIRYRAASGGVVSSLLIYMLEEKLIDAAIVVAAEKGNPSNSVALSVSNREAVLEVSGSRYSLAPIKPELEKAMNKNMKVAMVGLPCQTQALKKSYQSNWENNIKLWIGLFCGFNLSYEATEFILQKLKLKPQDLRSFEYRAGRWPGELKIETKDGKIFNFPKSIYNILNPLFVPSGCLNCHYLFNEYSDISVGDAWYNLPDKKGYSAVIIRSARGKHIFDDAVKKDYIEQQQIKPEILYKSHGHLIRYKKHRSRLSNAITHMIRFGWLGRFLKILPLGLLHIISKLYRKSIRI